MDDSHKMVGLVESVEFIDKRIIDLQAERERLLKEKEDVKAKARKAQKEVNAAKDEGEDTKLELK